MAILFNKTPVSSVAPVIEFPDNFVLNGHLYDKYTLNPLPLKFYNQGIVSNLAVFKRMQAYTGANWTTPRVLNGMEVDINDPDTFYYITLSNGAPSYDLVKVSRKNGEFERVSQVSLQMNSYEYADFNNGYRLSIVDQDADYLYVLKNPGDSSHGGYYTVHSQLFKIAKTTMTINTRSDFFNGSQRAKVVYVDGQYIYTMVEGHSYNYNILQRCRKFDMTVTEIGRVLSQPAFGSMPTSAIEEGTDYFMFYVPRLNTSTYELFFSQIVVNTVTGTMTVTDMPCKTLTGGIEANIINSGNISADYYYEPLYMVDGTDRYMVLFKIFPNGNNPNMSGSTYFDVYQIREDGVFIRTQSEVFPVSLHGFMEFNDNKTLILHNKYWIKSYQWNVGTKKYEMTNQKNDHILMVASDENNNLWIEYGNSRVEVLSHTAPMEFSAELELDIYNYIGVDIDTFVRYYTRNFENEYIQCVVQLTLDGPCKFVENDKKVITKTTSKTEPLTTPVVVTGDGVLRVGIKLVQG